MGVRSELNATAATSTTDAYEVLRSAVLSAVPMPCQGLGTVRRCGLAAWLRGLVVLPTTEPACAKPEPSLNTNIDPAPAACELTRIIVDIVIALVAEPSHA